MPDTIIGLLHNYSNIKKNKNRLPILFLSVEVELQIGASAKLVSIS